MTAAQHKVLTAERDRVLAAREAHAEALAIGAEQLRQAVPDYDDPQRVKALVEFIAEEYGDAAAQQFIASQGGTDAKLVAGLYRAMDRKNAPPPEPVVSPAPAPPPDDRRQRQETASEAEYRRAARRLEKTGRLRDAGPAIAEALGLSD